MQTDLWQDELRFVCFWLSFVNFGRKCFYQMLSLSKKPKPCCFFVCPPPNLLPADLASLLWVEQLLLLLCWSSWCPCKFSHFYSSDYSPHCLWQAYLSSFCDLFWSPNSAGLSPSAALWWADMLRPCLCSSTLETAAALTEGKCFGALRACEEKSEVSK